MPRIDFNENFDYRVLLTVQKGCIENNPRSAKKIKLTMKPSEGFNVLKARLLAKINNSDINNPSFADGHVWFARTKRAPQSKLIKLSDENFQEQLQYRWGNVSNGDISGWENETPPRTQEEGFCFELFMYIEKPQSNSSGGRGIRRATVPRIRQSLEAIQQYEQTTGIQLGEITRNHVAITHARQPEGTALAIPEDNTTRQAQILDQQRAEIQNAVVEHEAAAQIPERTIRIKLNGSWVDCSVDLRSLRAALGLPQHDIFTQGIYHGYVHPQPLL